MKRLLLGACCALALLALSGAIQEESAANNVDDSAQYSALNVDANQTAVSVEVTTTAQLQNTAANIAKLNHDAKTRSFNALEAQEVAHRAVPIAAIATSKNLA